MSLAVQWMGKEKARMAGQGAASRAFDSRSCQLFSKFKIATVFLLLIAIFSLEQLAVRAEEPEVGGAQGLGAIPESRLQRVDAMIAEGIAEGKMPGCVLCVGDSKQLWFLKAYGNRQTQPDIQPMTVDTVFDMASITKPVATGMAIMQLIDRGELRLGDRVVDFFPDFGVEGKDAISIRDLLIHQSGLIPDNALADYQQGPEEAWKKICQLKLVAPVGKEFKYSDVNFIVLGKLVEKISGQSLADYCRKELFLPLGMEETGFLPVDALKLRAAPTEQREERWMRGEVHDPRAYLLGGVAGHAGLFSTARDLSHFSQQVLRAFQQQGLGEGGAILSRRALEVMTSGQRVSTGLRGQSWDKQTGYSSNRGDFLSSEAFGHGGFTGTVLWIDPARDLFLIFLSNRVHPDGKGAVNPLAGKIWNVLVGGAGNRPGLDSRDLGDSTSDKMARVLTGIDVLEQSSYRQLKGKRIGLITNHTGRNRSGISTAKLLQQAEGVELTALFSPEHGFAGALDVSKVDDSLDPETGLKVFSLYGETRKPTPQMLEGLDTLVFDIQDIGCRFYTYVSTMGEAMKAAVESGKGFVVLDRPNPLGGIQIGGPLLDEGKESFVGYHRIPLQHGMTIGELARMLQKEKYPELDLTVIECQGWRRSMAWDETGLRWINPSPNMRSLNAAFLYPGIGIWEMTNLSVGRGTDAPFEWFGAPWIDANRVADQLNGYGVAGVRFVPCEFTPSSSKFQGELCQGVRLVIVDRRRLEPVSLGLAVAKALRQVHADSWDTKQLNRLLGNENLAKAILEGKASNEELKEIASSDYGDFLRRRRVVLLYE
ncbi:MAG: exo-beta-N-acetylmuramidase NamZ domain-containing protein [Pirellulaceae bacterium]